MATCSPKVRALNGGKCPGGTGVQQDQAQTIMSQADKSLGLTPAEAILFSSLPPAQADAEAQKLKTLRAMLKNRKPAPVSSTLFGF